MLGKVPARRGNPDYMCIVNRQTKDRRAASIKGVDQLLRTLDVYFFCSTLRALLINNRRYACKFGTVIPYDSTKLRNDQSRPGDLTGKVQTV